MRHKYSVLRDPMYVDVISQSPKWQFSTLDVPVASVVLGSVMDPMGSAVPGPRLPVTLPREAAITRPAFEWIVRFTEARVQSFHPEPNHACDARYRDLLFLPPDDAPSMMQEVTRAVMFLHCVDGEGHQLADVIAPWCLTEFADTHRADRMLMPMVDPEDMAWFRRVVWRMADTERFPPTPPV